MDKCNASERKKIIFLYLTALSLRAPGEGVICRGGVSPPKAISRTSHPDKAQRRGISSTYFDSLSTGEAL